MHLWLLIYLITLIIRAIRKFSKIFCIDICGRNLWSQKKILGCKITFLHGLLANAGQLGVEEEREVLTNGTVLPLRVCVCASSFIILHSVVLNDECQTVTLIARSPVACNGVTTAWPSSTSFDSCTPSAKPTRKPYFEIIQRKGEVVEDLNGFRFRFWIFSEINVLASISKNDQQSMYFTFQILFLLCCRFFQGHFSSI